MVKQLEDKDQHLAFSILDHFDQIISSGKISDDHVESLQVAMQCISEVFNVELSNEEQRDRYRLQPANLSFIFDMYLKTKDKYRSSSSSGATSKVTPATFVAKDPTTTSSSSSSSSTTSASVQSDQVKKEQAERFKALGNEKIKTKEYDQALEFYDQAILLDPLNAVYYANRAAAFGQKGDHLKAIQDAQKSLSLDPSYSKAYSRLGHAYFSLSRYQESIDAYNKGLLLDPQNATMISALNTAKLKAQQSTPTAPAGFPGVGGFPGAGAGGMPDLSSLMGNPMFSRMAQQLMSNPQMMQSALNMMQSNNGQPPDISQLMQNPEMMEMARQFAAEQQNAEDK